MSKSVLDKLKGMVDSSGKSKKEVAKLAGMSYTSLNRVLSGKQELCLHHVQKICGALGYHLKLELKNE